MRCRGNRRLLTHPRPPPCHRRRAGRQCREQRPPRRARWRDVELTCIGRPRRAQGSRPDRTERYELRTPEQEARMAERLALFTCAMAREQAPALLEMLA